MPDLASLLLGALIATAVQWIVGPRIERQVRAQERWERDVLALGELLTLELPVVREEAFRAWQRWSIWYDIAASNNTDLTNPQFVEKADELRADAKPALEAFGRLLVRVEWLSARVGVGAGAETTGLTGHLYVSMSKLLPTSTWLPDMRPEMDKGWEREITDRARLLGRVTELAKEIGPGKHKSGVAAVRWKWRNWRSKRKRD